jgi:hypothetical protein
LRTNVSWDEILGTMAEWLRERHSLAALEIVAAAIERRGSRGDIVVLREHLAMDSGDAREIVADTEFAVFRRTPA